MFLIDKLLLLPVAAPTQGFFALMRRIQQEAEAELTDPARVKRELLELQRLYQTGEVGEEEFQERESRVLRRLRVTAQRERAAGRRARSEGSSSGRR